MDTDLNMILPIVNTNFNMILPIVNTNLNMVLLLWTQTLTWYCLLWTQTLTWYCLLWTQTLTWYCLLWTHTLTCYCLLWTQTLTLALRLPRASVLKDGVLIMTRTSETLEWIILFISNLWNNILNNLIFWRHFVDEIRDGLYMYQYLLYR